MLSINDFNQASTHPNCSSKCAEAFSITYGFPCWYYMKFSQYLYSGFVQM